MQVVGCSLGADGSTMYRTAVGDFFLYPSANKRWVVIWEPVIQSQRFDDKVAWLPNRQDAVEWMEAALSFA